MATTLIGLAGLAAFWRGTIVDTELILSYSDCNSVKAGSGWQKIRDVTKEAAWT